MISDNIIRDETHRPWIAFHRTALAHAWLRRFIQIVILQSKLPTARCSAPRNARNLEGLHHRFLTRIEQVSCAATGAG